MLDSNSADDPPPKKDEPAKTKEQQKSNTPDDTPPDVPVSKKRPQSPQVKPKREAYKRKADDATAAPKRARKQTVQFKMSHTVKKTKSSKARARKNSPQPKKSSRKTSAKQKKSSRKNSPQPRKSSVRPKKMPAGIKKRTASNGTQWCTCMKRLPPKFDPKTGGWV
ncbi:Hypothetical protein NTJ_11866 [Nesidiocoris tenuis]|nr:Hypothetical protein NTJ_11866 [Nesidiocoris tenuis]